MGCGVAVVADLWMTNYHAVLGCFALACIAVAVGLTHGVGGNWRYFSDNWQFVLPNGSYVFICLQTLGWFFFAIAILIFLLQIFSWGPSEKPPLVTGGVSGLVAEMLLAVSLLNRGDGDAPSRCCVGVYGSSGSSGEGSEATDVFVDTAQMDTNNKTNISG